jgi:hypothetical protein
MFIGCIPERKYYEVGGDWDETRMSLASVSTPSITIEETNAPSYASQHIKLTLQYRVMTVASF